MKRILLIVLLLFSLEGAARVTAVAHKVYLKQWDSQSKTYKQIITHDCSFKVFIYDDHISLDDENNSRYTIVGQPKPADKNGVATMIYNTVDDAGSNCTVSLGDEGNRLMLIIEYEHVKQKCYWITER